MRNVRSSMVPARPSPPAILEFRDGKAARVRMIVGVLDIARQVGRGLGDRPALEDRIREPLTANTAIGHRVVFGEFQVVPKSHVLSLSRERIPGRGFVGQVPGIPSRS
jgi:hypothetical protein